MSRILTWIFDNKLATFLSICLFAFVIATICLATEKNSLESELDDLKNTTAGQPNPQQILVAPPVAPPVAPVMAPVAPVAPVVPPVAPVAPVAPVVPVAPVAPVDPVVPVVATRTVNEAVRVADSDPKPTEVNKGDTVPVAEPKDQAPAQSEPKTNENLDNLKKLCDDLPDKERNELIKHLQKGKAKDSNAEAPKEPAPAPEPEVEAGVPQ